MASLSLLQATGYKYRKVIVLMIFIYLRIHVDIMRTHYSYIFSRVWYRIFRPQRNNNKSMRRGRSCFVMKFQTK